MSASHPSSTPSSTKSSIPSPIPPPIPVDTHPTRGILKSPESVRRVSGSTFFNREDAYKAPSPPRLRPLTEVKSTGIASLNGTLHSSHAASAAAAALRPAVASLRPPPAIPILSRVPQEKKKRSSSRRKNPPGNWKKLLWIKQPFPDNYTDTETFLDHLQLNPKLRPYDFWPLVADSTVIFQHVCSVAVFICCFAGIYQDRISPISVVGVGSLATLLGWSLWDQWMGQDEERQLASAGAEWMKRAAADGPDDAISTGSEASFNPLTTNGSVHLNSKSASKGLGLNLSSLSLSTRDLNGRVSRGSKNSHSHSISVSSHLSVSPVTPLPDSGSDSLPPSQLSNSRANGIKYHSGTTMSPSLSPRIQSRIKTFKSALLICFTLLGLSPILKSLTRSTSSDSIWALATWLLIINVFFFDYSRIYVPRKAHLSRAATDQPAGESSLQETSGSAPPFPSSLSTNAALMASTVLASRLPSITHVFSLTVFSIEVFGLFPVFRRHLRLTSWNGHVLLTVFLIIASSAGLSLILSTSYTHTYGASGGFWGWIGHVLLRSVMGIVIGGLGTSLVMGGCSWWLISLQRYKNVVIGPWDPARPILAGGPLRGRGSSG